YLRELRRLVAADAELHPDHLRTRRQRERLLDDRDGILRGAEYVDHVDRFGDVAERGVGLLSEQFLAGETGVDRDHAVAALKQILERKITGTAGIGRDPDHRDRLHRIEDAANVAVVVFVGIHTFSCRGLRRGGANGGRNHRSSQTGVRFSTNADMPSSASRAIIFLSMSSLRWLS